MFNQLTCKAFSIYYLYFSFWGDADLRLIAYMVPDPASPSDVGSNSLPKNHPQEGNKYLFSIDVKHESNHPEMGPSSSAVVLEASNATPSSLTLESPITKLSRRRSKVTLNIVFLFFF